MKLHCNAYGLSRLPLSTTVSGYEDSASVFYNTQMDQLPVTSTQVRFETQRDVILSHVLDSVSNGHSALPAGDNRFCPYSNRFHELSCHLICLMLGNRVIIPEKKFRDRVLQDPHEGHFGICQYEFHCKIICMVA